MTPTQKLKRLARIYEHRSPIKGSPRSFISSHTRYSLEGALIDLERMGKADKVCLNTIRRVIGQLAKMEKYLPLD